MANENDKGFDRIDERTKSIQDDLRNFRDDVRLQVTTVLDRLREAEARQIEKISHLERSHSELVGLIDKNYVTKESFKPVQHLVYGFVGLVVTSVLTAILSLVVFVKH